MPLDWLRGATAVAFVCNANAVAGLARLIDPELAQWVDSYVAFPNAMVDRITPATGPRELQMVRDKGVEDDAPVTDISTEKGTSDTREMDERALKLGARFSAEPRMPIGNRISVDVGGPPS